MATTVNNPSLIPSHRRSTTPAPPPRTSTAGLTKLTDADRIVAQAGLTCAPLPQQQPDHLPMSNTTLASPPPPSLPSPLSTANTSPSLSSENFVFTTPAPSAFSPSLLRPLARFIAGTRRALVRRGSPKPQIPQLSISSEPCLVCLDPRSLSNSYASSSGRPPSLNPIAPSPKSEFSSTSVLNLNSAATCDYSQQLMTVQVSLNGIPCTLLVDSGASRNFISTAFAKKHNLTLCALDQALRVRLADGTITTTSHHLPSASVSFSSTFSYSSSFVATHLPGYDGILGKPFLTDVNPIIDWTTNSFTSPFSLAGDVF
ncbi:hypothetical protein CEUSTIGMA_g11338.t1, partial [Chlamydomonas eustigma]